MSVQCIIDAWYEGICRDVDTGEGGLTPASYGDSDNYHMAYFQRTLREELRQKTGGAIDRCVQIEYKGTKENKGFISGNKRRAVYHIQVCVGYFAGDHHDITNVIMFADDVIIQNWAMNPKNYPSCKGSCVESVFLVDSQSTKKGREQYVLETTFAVQITTG
jgi:hypothetical protein